MRCMKISTALLAVPVCVFALACESDTATEESLVAPPGPSFASAPSAACTDVGVTGVVFKGANVYGTDGDDHISCTNAPKKLRIFGGDGNDIISGGDGNDLIRGGLGDDVISGDDGDDDARVP